MYSAIVVNIDECLNMKNTESNTRLGEYEKYYRLGYVCGEKGTVWSAKHKPSSSRALKIYDLDQCQDEFSRIQNEVGLVRQLNHKNIIKYAASFSKGLELWIAMPLYGFTSASRVVATHFNDGLSEQALCLIMKDVLHALQYLHIKGIIHRSVRGSHILIEANGNCVLSGFRHSVSVVSQGRWEKPVHSYPEEAACNLNWSSPELLKQDVDGYCEKTDIYSLGITVCELGNGEVPYYKLDPELMLVEKIYGREPFLNDMNTCRLLSENGKDSGVGGSYADYLANIPQIASKYYTASAHQFVASCLVGNQHARPSAEKLLSHAFVKQCRKIASPLYKILHPVTPIDEKTDFLGDNSDVINDEEITEDYAEEISWDL